MKLLHYSYHNEEQIGAVFLNHVYSLKQVGIYSKDFNELIDNYTLKELLQLCKNIKTCSFVSLDQVVKFPPVIHPKGDILCLGMNYYDHQLECKNSSLNMDSQMKSVYFSKRCYKAITDGNQIDCHKDITKQVDYECELGYILGKTSYKLKKEETRDAIFGYFVANDVSARELQKEHLQFYYGKSLDTFSVLGSTVVTADEFESFPKGYIRTYVNQELRQNNDVQNMIFDIPTHLVELTNGITLEKGTIIFTGTPKGVGMGMNPPKFLVSGDRVRCEIENIGILENEVK